MEVKFFDGIFGGDSVSGAMLCLGLTGGDFWGRIEGCQNLYRGRSADSIELEKIISTGHAADVLITVPAEVTHLPSESYVYLLRRVSICGDEEKSFSGALKVSFDDDGNLIVGGCNEILEASLKQIPGPLARLTWFYSPIDQAKQCQQFKIYSDGGSGQIDFNAPVSLIEYKGMYCYSYESAILSEGRHRFCVRSAADNGQETTGKEVELLISGSPTRAADCLYADTM